MVGAILSCNFIVGAILSWNFIVGAILSCNFIASWCNFELQFYS